VHPDPTYLDRIDPRHFDHRYREKVVKYTNELAEDFGLQAHTAGIACNYFDRFIPLVLAQRPVGRQEIQVIASTCLLIAAKFSDRKLPPLSELAVVHEHTVEPHIFADQEAAILEVLEWKLHVRLPETFVEPLRRCLRDAPVDAAIRERMQFFIDLSVYGYGLLRYSPAEIAGGSLLAAWKFSNEHNAVDYFLLALADACATTEERLKCCTNELVRYYQVCFPNTVKSCEHVFQPISPDCKTETDLDSIPSPCPVEEREEEGKEQEAAATMRSGASPVAVAAAASPKQPAPPADGRVDSPDTVFAADLAPLLCSDPLSCTDDLGRS